MNNLSKIPAFVWRLLFAAALVAVFSMTEAKAADGECCLTVETSVAAPQAESWVFARGRYTHDPDTGGRVAQYAMKPPVEPLPDPRAITSGYTRTRSVLRGADGSASTSYRVQSYGNGRGGMDAEWERFHDAWRGSTTSGGTYQVLPYGGYGYGNGSGFGNGGYGGGFYPPQPTQPGFPDYPQPGRRYRGRNNPGYGPGYGRPDAGRLDPDGADGYHDGRRRTPDREFYNRTTPTPAP